MKNEKYEDFLRSDFWWDISRKCKIRDNHRCVDCGSAGGQYRLLDAHHEEYPPNYDWYATTLDMLVTVCRRCHKKRHNEEITFEQLCKKVDALNMPHSKPQPEPPPKPSVVVEVLPAQHLSKDDEDFLEWLKNNPL